MNAEIFSQNLYRCRIDWGYKGAREAAERGDILVVVDTLSFSTAVVTAVHFGGVIYPCSRTDNIAEYAKRVDGEAAVGRKDVPEKGRFSLSPLTYVSISPGERVILASPNGATCSRYARSVPYLFVGALVNARQLADAVSALLDSTDLCVTILACGERWRIPSEDGELRVAIEDYLGAGAILSYLKHTKSPEARVCEGAFLHTQNDLRAILWECGSGRELREMGYSGDVEHSARLNVYDVAPIMRDERILKG